VKEPDHLEALERVFGPNAWPKAVRLLEAVLRVRRGESAEPVALSIGTTTKRVAALARSKNLLPLALKDAEVPPTDAALTKAKKQLGQMLLGKCAEIAFEELYRSEMHSEELQLVNTTDKGTDTDYRLLNGKLKPVFRINIKFHGAQFRQARDLVGLAPEDCFPLATYKILSALQKQDQEALPYFFAVIGVPDLTGESVGARLPAPLLRVAAVVLSSKASGKREFEDRIVESLVRSADDLFRGTFDIVRAAPWYMLSARRAENLLKEKLFDRVYALRIRNFTQAYRRAEVDMHFSLREDLKPLGVLFEEIRAHGVARASTLLERGDI
jgi:hypothetical protein